MGLLRHTLMALAILTVISLVFQYRFAGSGRPQLPRRLGSFGAVSLANSGDVVHTNTATAPPPRSKRGCPNHPTAKQVWKYVHLLVLIAAVLYMGFICCRFCGVGVCSNAPPPVADSEPEGEREAYEVTAAEVIAARTAEDQAVQERVKEADEAKVQRKAELRVVAVAAAARALRAGQGAQAQAEAAQNAVTFEVAQRRFESYEALFETCYNRYANGVGRCRFLRHFLRMTFTLIALYLVFMVCVDVVKPFLDRCLFIPDLDRVGLIAAGLRAVVGF